MPLRENIGRFKYLQEDQVDSEYSTLTEKLDASVDELIKKAGKLND